MNWRVSSLDKYRLVSNSDAHSPPILGRESTVFDTELDYFALRAALETGDGLVGTVEFFPEEGKYHVDGHRKCGVRLDPEETRALGGLCPSCGKPVTVGVLSRVAELADRPDGHRPAGAAEFHNLVPLPEIMSEIVGTGPKSKKVLSEIDKLTATFGPELSILRDVPPAELERSWPLLAEAVTRLRRGEVIRDAGYDGEYGEIRMFEPGELAGRKLIAAPALFEELAEPSLFEAAPQPASLPEAVDDVPAKPVRPKPVPEPALFGDPEQVVAEPGLFDDVPELAARPTIPEPEPVEEPDEPVDPVPEGPVGELDPMLFGSVLDGLDPDQRAAAGGGAGPVLIVAGPGTGKTRTLTHRIAHLVTERGIPPEHCLAITFTRRAAEEMAERLAALVPDHAALTIATFHSLGVRILREQHARVGLSASFGIADRATALAIAVEVTGDEKQARAILVARGAGEQDDAVERYVKALRQRDLVDFDDLVTLPVTLFDAEPDLAATYRDRYRWVSVDEYQDVDERQYRLLRHLVPAGGNLTVIGDPDQAIYRFRGADVGFFLRFQADFPSARTVSLRRNYRSSARVLTASVSMIAPTTLVADRELEPMGEYGDAFVGVHHAVSERAEAEFVARTIDQLLGGGTFNSFDSGRVSSAESTHSLGFSDFAVLYRTDRQARAVLDALGQAGWPCQKRSHDRLADRPGVDRLAAELPYVTSAGPLRDRLRMAARTLVDQSPDAESELYTAVDLLAPLANRCGEDTSAFLTELALGVEVDTWDPRADRISLLTLHASKGLEFPVVFVVGCADGLLPLRWPGTTPTEEELAEERRLLFVGMTRAQRNLYLSHTGERSPFLSTMDTSVWRQVGEGRQRKARDTQLRLL
jgi:superfamily I DNA/RNA helicase